jgi:methionyl aminopeptidase
VLERIPVKSSDEIACMREVCRTTAKILDEVHEVVLPGRTTEDINTFVHQRMLDLGATPATLNYKGYPKSVCTSLNEVVCHGIPDSFAVMKVGDIINVDITCKMNGFFGDSSRMFFVGGRDACSPSAVQLVDDTYKALRFAIAQVHPGAHIGDIGAAIQSFVEDSGRRYGIVREYTGHGIGREFHEPPQVVHVGRKGHGPVMRPGMTFTIEPMINLGGAKTTLSTIDGWTVRTADGKLSAQWEHTVLVTERGYEILTLSEHEKA